MPKGGSGTGGRAGARGGAARPAGGSTLDRGRLFGTGRGRNGFVDEYYAENSRAGRQELLNSRRGRRYGRPTRADMNAARRRDAAETARVQGILRERRNAAARERRAANRAAAAPAAPAPGARRRPRRRTA